MTLALGTRFSHHFEGWKDCRQSLFFDDSHVVNVWLVVLPDCVNPFPIYTWQVHVCIRDYVFLVL